MLLMDGNSLILWERDVVENDVPNADPRMGKRRGEEDRKACARRSPSHHRSPFVVAVRGPSEEGASHPQPEPGHEHRGGALHR